MAQTGDDWIYSTHRDLTDLAASRMGLSASGRTVLRRNVIVPDAWGRIDKVRHYMPLCSFFAGELTREAIREAATGSSAETRALEKLGHAMHFLQDAGNPWHARPLLPLVQKNHRPYEEYVARNMRDGFCFRRALQKRSARPNPYAEFTHRIGDGAAYLARHTVTRFSFLDRTIRTDPRWQEREDVAEVTVSILGSCLRMCETQIHAFTTRAQPAVPRPVRLPFAVTLTFLGSDKRRLLV